MNDKLSLDELRAQAEQIVRDNPAPPNCIEDRKIVLFEDELRESGLRFKVEISFSELSPQLVPIIFNQEHDFRGEHYCLIWSRIKPESGLWSLMVLNQKSSGVRRLLDCPLTMKQQLLPFLEVLAVKISSKLKESN